MLRVTKPIQFTFDIMPACLQTDLSDEKSNVELFVTGWGSTSAASKIVLKFVEFFQLSFTSKKILFKNEKNLIYFNFQMNLETERSPELRKAQLTTMPLEECNRILSEYNEVTDHPALLRNGIGESQYCAYDPDRRNDSCQGDSG